MTRLKVIVLIASLAIFPGRALSGTYINVGDEIYQGLARLEAEGVIPSALLSTKPMSRKEAGRLLAEAESNLEGKSAFVKELVQSLRRRLCLEGRAAGEPAYVFDKAYARYIYGSSNVQVLNYDNDGELYRKSSNVRTGFQYRVEDLGPLAVYVNPEYRFSENDNLGTLKKAYGVLGFSNLDIIAGKDSQWWGPGQHGAILLSNNAEPFTMVRLTNPSPTILPWVFRHLGDFQFTFFVTTLEKERNFPEPYLWGLRFDFKPHPNLEIGLDRTALLGGRGGRPEDIGTWGKSFFPFFRAENTGTLEDPGDQRAGGDIKWTIPWRIQPLQIYTEVIGEDLNVIVPNNVAFIFGVYLPRIAGFERLDYRVEFATTEGTRLSPAVWYNHFIYESYSYKKRIIGHHIGTDSHEFFTEFSYHLPEKDSRVSLSYNRIRHNLRNVLNLGASEIDHEVRAGVDLAVSERLGVSAAVAHGWIRNLGNTPREMLEVSMLTSQVSLRF